MSYEYALHESIKFDKRVVGSFGGDMISSCFDDFGTFDK